MPSEHTEITSKAFGFKLPHTNALPRRLCNEFTCCCARSWTLGSGRRCLKMSCSGDVGLAIGTEGWRDEKKWRGKRQPKKRKRGCRKQKRTVMLPQCHLRHWWDSDPGKDRKYHRHTQHSLGPLQSNYCLLSCHARCFGEQSICHWWQRLPSQPQKKGLKTDQSPEERREKSLDTQPGNTSHMVTASLNAGFDFHLSNVSECLIRAITAICGVKVATVTLGKCRAAAILTLLWCYFEEGLRRTAREFSSQSFY